MIGANGLFQIHNLKDENKRPSNINSIRSLTQSSYLGNNQSVCRVLGHYLMFVSTLDERLGVQLQMNGFWEMNITEYIARCMKPGMNVVDVGANYGYFSMLMSTLVGSSGSVTSLEANPYLSSLIIKSSKVNGFENRLKVINLGVSDHTAEDIDFAYSDDTPMNGLLASNISSSAQQKHYPNLLKVKVKSIDDIFYGKQKIDFIKVDIEGSEDLFWYGSKKVRNENPDMVILMEFNRARYEHVEDWVHQIYSEGYHVLKISHKKELYQSLSEGDMLNSPTSHHMMLAISKKPNSLNV